MVSRRKLKIASAALILSGILFTFLGIQAFDQTPVNDLDIFVGLDIAYGDEQTAIEQIDKVADYVNLIILGSLELTTDTEKLTQVCEYMFQKGLHFIVYVGFGVTETSPPQGPDSQFFSIASQRWGDKFLGVYLFDEPGGKVIDGAHAIDLSFASTYAEAATLYTHKLGYFLGNVSDYYLPAEFRLFTSDYALYWYDYLAGYDVVFAEYVGNQSRQIATGLCRGAAKTLNKEWGAIITWSDNLEDFVQNPQQIYNDMVLAYQNGAKYIIVFNSPDRFPPPTQYGTLTPEHFEKMEQFWNYALNHPTEERYPAETAFVLPRDYGFGFRGPNDRIWGVWQADNLESQIWEDVQSLLQTHVLYLDIVYETKIENVAVNLPYNKLIFWNGTITNE